MCFGCCGCTRITYFLSNTLYVLEKIAACLAVTALVTCLIVTMIFMVSIGVGLGYNYCFVDLKTIKGDVTVAPEKPEESTSGGWLPGILGFSLDNDSQWNSNSNDLSTDTRRLITDNDAVPFDNMNNSTTDSIFLARKRREENKPNLLVAFLRSRMTDIKSVTDLVKIQ